MNAHSAPPSDSAPLNNNRTELANHADTLDFAANAVAEDIANFFTEVINPVFFSPLAYIEETIDRMVANSDASPQIKAGITSDTLISVRYLQQQPTTSYLPGQGGLPPVALPASRQFKLSDIVTDSYLKQLKNATNVRIAWPSEYPERLTRYFENANLQRAYMDDVEKTFSRPDVDYISKLLIEQELEHIAQTYLDRTNISPQNRALMTAFLQKQAPLQTVTFQGASQVELGQVAHLRWPKGSGFERSGSLLIFLGAPPERAVLDLPANVDLLKHFIKQSSALKHRILGRLPLYERLKAGNDKLVYRQIYIHNRLVDVPPLTFAPNDDIVGELYTRRLERMLWDMDILVSTDAERFTDKGLEVGVLLLQALSTAVLLPAGGAVLAGRMVASFLLGLGAASLEALRGSLADTPDEKARHYTLALISGVSEIAGPLAQKMLGKALSLALQSSVSAKVTKLLRKYYRFDVPHVPTQVIVSLRKPSTEEVRRIKRGWIKRLAEGPEQAQSLIRERGQMLNKIVEGHDLVVYRGQVFRGDMRPPEVVFQEGFQLRTPAVDIKKDIHQVTGVRGGFGGGRDALDPDGKGISTSFFYFEENTGAFVYGGKKGGYTYLIDAHRLDGYHLYANHYKAQYPKAPHVDFKPTEINYGDGFPAVSILGAYDQAGAFIPNHPALKRFAREQAKEELKELLQRAAVAAAIEAQTPLLSER